MPTETAEKEVIPNFSENAAAEAAEAEPAPYLRPSDRRRLAAGLPLKRPLKRNKPQARNEVQTAAPAVSGTEKGQLKHHSSEIQGGGASISYTPAAADNSHYIYLTFDDGPHYGTDDCMDVLAVHDIRATFFVCGWNFRADQGAGRVAWNKRMAKRIAEGHVVANHSHSHRHRKYPDTEWFMADMDENLAQFRAVLPDFPESMLALSRLPTVNTWRLGPGDARNSTDRTQRGNGAVADRLLEQGTRVYGWDVEWKFKNGRGGRVPNKPAAEIYEVIERTRKNPSLTRTRNHVVLLMHDNMFRKSAGTKAELDQLVQLLTAGGYQFATIDEYPIYSSETALDHGGRADHQVVGAGLN